MIEVGIVNGSFQVLHLKHIEYILAAKMKCRKLYIGLSGAGESPFSQGITVSNPLTYFERYEMLQSAMREFRVPREEYDILPFPIQSPGDLKHYLPEEGVHFLGVVNLGDEKKYEILRSLNVPIEVLWRRGGEDAISSEEVRRKMLLGEDWEQLVPKSVVHYLKQKGLVERILRLENMKVEEKAGREGETDDRNQWID